jgi:hypothetical protein
MRIEVQLQPDAALDLHRKEIKRGKNFQENQSSAAQLANEVRDLGLKLEPIHPGQTHPLLAPYFSIEVPDRQTAERVIDQLLQNKIVEAAYLQPDEQAP